MLVLKYLISGLLIIALFGKARAKENWMISLIMIKTVILQTIGLQAITLKAISPQKIAKLLMALSLLLLALSGCATNKVVSGDQPSIDPYEGYNRFMFSFNSGVDRYVLKPATIGYRFITPDYVERRLSSVFSNLLEVRNAFNGTLQGKTKKSLNYAGRFLINSTLGLAGLYDVAQHMGLKKTEGEDFGQTLGKWGVKSGPYIVLPLLGPSNVRDGLGLPVDITLNPINHIDHHRTRDSTSVIRLLDTRSRLLESEKLINGDPYIFIRDTYLQRREYLVKDGVVEDTFGNSLDDEFGPGDAF